MSINIGRIELRDVDTVADYCICRESILVEKYQLLKHLKRGHGHSLTNE